MAANGNTAINTAASAYAHARIGLLTNCPATNTAATPHPIAGLDIGKVTAT